MEARIHIREGHGPQIVIIARTAADEEDLTHFLKYCEGFVFGKLNHSSSKPPSVSMYGVKKPKRKKRKKKGLSLIDSRIVVN